MSANKPIDLLIAAARQGRQKIREYVAGTKKAKPSKKRDGSLLTETDLASQDVICSFLNRNLPGIPILSEETRRDGTDISTGQWLVIDPLDGTTNFTRGIPFYSVTIAYMEDGIPQAGIVMPVAQDYCYAAVKNSFAVIIDDDFHRTPIRCTSRPLEESILCVTCDYSVPSGRETWWQWLDKLRPPTCFRLRLFQSSALELCLLAEGKIDGYLHPTDNPWDMAAAGLIVQEAGG
ncbi:MAG: inositol monophosphatase family protein, partial [Sedimentisphaerales bacterium]|nr:inositol monophosphatase family protein [Sedimentisphaerales bacterium]